MILGHSVHAAGDVERHCGSKLRGPLPGPESPRDAPLSALRDALRRGEGAVGGALRAPVRVLARLRRRAGAAVPGLRAFRERLRPDPMSGLRRGIPARVLVQDTRAVPVLRGQALGCNGRVAGGGGLRGGGARAVGVRHAEDAAAVLPSPPGAARRARARGLGDGAGADVCGGRRRGDAAGDGRRGPDRGRPGQLAPTRARNRVARRLDA